MTMDQLRINDKKHIWHPCSQMHDYEKYPAVHIERAEGVWLYREDGSRILDAVSSWWINIFGHGNPLVKQRIKEQLDKLEHVLFSNYTHTPAIELAAHLAGLFDGKLDKVFYTDNGSSAVEAALKMSYHYWYNKGIHGKNNFIYLRGAYHGETMGALSVCSLDLYKEIYAPLLMQTAIEVEGPECYRCPYGLQRESCQAECFDKLEAKLTQLHSTTAAVILEPIIQCANNMNMYSPVYLQKLRAHCSELDVHLICDEIATGFGRTGRMMACRHAGVVPDFVTVSKAITNGFLPLAAVLTSDEVYNAFYAPYTEMKAFMHSHTYAGNPLACAAACAVFELFAASDVLAGVQQTGNRIREQVLSLEDHPHVGEVRTCGLITAIELVKDKKTKTAFDWRERLGYRVYRLAEQRGVLLRNLGDVLYFNPPYCINENEIEFMTRVAREAILDILKSL